MNKSDSHNALCVVICIDFEGAACVANSRHWFTTSFLWRKVPESDARSVREWSPLPCGYVAGAGCKHGDGDAGERREGEVVHCWTVSSVVGLSTNDGESRA